jgi:4-hydroxy-tetrahydrodipicolinate reductase
MNIVLIGYGKMGQVVEQLLHDTPGITLTAIVGKTPNADIDTELSAIDAAFDCIIDFSHHSNIEKILHYAQAKQKPVVICTTGFNPAQEAGIKTAAQKIPVVYSQNMSVGVNVMKDVVARISAALGDNFDIELIEKHHNLKEDAPSGTAKMLLSAIHGIDKKNIVNGRNGLQKRAKNDIGVHAVRGGTIVGEHTVIFAGIDEIIEIKHTALSKKIFAAGALRAAQFVVKQKAGLYSMKEVLG